LITGLIVLLTFKSEHWQLSLPFFIIATVLVLRK
jgi:hypothetical protein